MDNSFTVTIESLGKHHNRAEFSCGVDELDTYLHRFARQNEKRNVSKHFVATANSGSAQILGYYALSSGSIEFDLVPDELKKQLPRYPIPVAHIGRLAVSQSIQGQGLGEHLLIDALSRISRIAEKIGIHAIEVVAINNSARQFYLKYGFIPLIDDNKHLYLPLSKVKKLGLV